MWRKSRQSSPTGKSEQAKSPSKVESPGIDLEKSGLILVGPDSIEWDTEFHRRGLALTATSSSGGGEGHNHYFYRRPEGCPIGRINKPGQYDIQSGGYAVAPPALHISGREYSWITSPWETDIPEAPDWVVDMLIEGVERVPEEPITPVEGTNEPPVRLPGRGLDLWNGVLVVDKADGKIKPASDDVEVDRSNTEFYIAMELWQANATLTVIASALAERDITLGYLKYAERKNDLEYWRIAQKVSESRNGHSQSSYASESFRISETYMLGDSEETRFRLVPSIDVPLPATDIKEGQLGPFIPHAASLVMLVGETSAGKTVLAKNMAFHLAEGITWAGLPAVQRRVVYVDLESPSESHVDG